MSIAVLSQAGHCNVARVAFTPAGSDSASNGHEANGHVLRHRAQRAMKHGSKILERAIGLA
jgi:hypothetical protein